MSATDSAKKPVFINPVIWHTLFAIFCGLLAVAWAMMSHYSWSLLSLDVMVDEVETLTDSWTFHLAGMYFAHPWIAMGVGAASGVVYGIWQNAECLWNFESKVSKICRKARGERVNLHWQQQIATWGQVGLLLGVVGISAIWPLSIKTVMYSLACTAFAVGIPVQRKLYKEAHSRLCIISFDEKTAARVRSWRLRQNVAAVFATVLMVVGMVWLSWIMFFEFIPDVRESAREHEQTVAELRIRRLLPSGQ